MWRSTTGTKNLIKVEWLPRTFLVSTFAPQVGPAWTVTAIAVAVTIRATKIWNKIVWMNSLLAQDAILQIKTINGATWNRFESGGCNGLTRCHCQIACCPRCWTVFFLFPRVKTIKTHSYQMVSISMWENGERYRSHHSFQVENCILTDHSSTQSRLHKYTGDKEKAT